MTSDTTQAMPSQATLQALLGRQFSIGDAEGRSAPATLSSVDQGVALDASYVSYSATFELDGSVSAPQGSYRVAPLPAPGEPDTPEAWLLFVTPVRPARNGRPRLEAVFHVERPVEAPAPQV